MCRLASSLRTNAWLYQLVALVQQKKKIDNVYSDV